MAPYCLLRGLMGPGILVLASFLISPRGLYAPITFCLTGHIPSYLCSELGYFLFSLKKKKKSKVISLQLIKINGKQKKNKYSFSSVSPQP